MEVIIRDNGCGMDTEQVKKVQDPFFTTRKTRKVGLGVPFLNRLQSAREEPFPSPQRRERAPR